MTIKQQCPQWVTLDSRYKRVKKYWLEQSLLMPPTKRGGDYRRFYIFKKLDEKENNKTNEKKAKNTKAH